MGLLLEDDYFSSPKDIYLIHQSFGELICIWGKELKENHPYTLPQLHLGRAGILQHYTRNLKSNFLNQVDYRRLKHPLWLCSVHHSGHKTAMGKCHFTAPVFVH